MERMIPKDEREFLMSVGVEFVNVAVRIRVYVSVNTDGDTAQFIADRIEA